MERNLRIGDAQIDLVATVRIGEQRQRLALEVKNSGQPRIARSAANQLARVLAQDQASYGVFAAPYISPQTAEICNQEKIGYLDLAGNCRLTFGQVYIEQMGSSLRKRSDPPCPDRIFRGRTLRPRGALPKGHGLCGA